MSGVELVVILLAASAGLQVLARRINVPHPVLLVIGGLVLAFVPGLPRITIAPETLFLIFVPPLLYWGSLTTSLRDFRAHLSPITRYGTLVVLLTMTAVAVVIHALSPAFPWSAAFLLGAIVAPPDPVAAIAVLRPLGAPRRMVTIIEGEGLVNDATALVAYQMAVAAVVTGTFSIATAGLRLLLTAAGGIGVGLIVGWLVAFVHRKLIGRFPIVENTLSLLTPFFAYLPADWLNASGVLSVVTMGLYLGHRAPRILSPATRVQGEAMWTVVQFLLESLIFILVGLELPTAVHALRQQPLALLLVYAALITVTVIAVRMVYTWLAVVILRARARRRGDHGPPWSQAAFIGWMGMRGGDSLVIAMALPLVTAAGKPFPARDLILFLTFAVILATLVLQGLTAVPLLRRLNLRQDDDDDGEEAHARRVMTEAGLNRLEHVTREAADEPVVRGLTDKHRERLHLWSSRDHALHDHGDGRPPAPPDGPAEQHAMTYRRLREAMMASERDALIDLRDRGTISDDALRRVQRELDLEAMMLESVEDDAPEPYDER